MAYWLVKKETNSITNRCVYYFDGNNDLAHLPTETKDGWVQDDNYSHLKCNKGSMAWDIKKSKLYILDSTGNWVKVGFRTYPICDPIMNPIGQL